MTLFDISKIDKSDFLTAIFFDNKKPHERKYNEHESYLIRLSNIKSIYLITHSDSYTVIAEDFSDVEHAIAHVKNKADASSQILDLISEKEEDKEQ